MRPCILVADTTRARLFIRRPLKDGSGRSQLIEKGAILNPEEKVPDHELFSGLRSDAGARVGGSVGGRVYTMDDGRKSHEEEVLKRFAILLAKESSRVAREVDADELILAAAPRMLGYLRAESKHFDPKLRLREVDKDLAGMSPTEIDRHLPAS